MDVGRIIHHGSSRRSFLRGAGFASAGGAATLLAACGDGDETTIQSGGIEGTEDDVQTLNAALGLELTMVDAYTRTVGLLRGPIREAGETFLTHEQEHVDVLTKAITQLGGTTTAKRLPIDYTGISGRPEVLGLWRRLEDLAIATYIDAIPKLSSGALRATVATVATCEAEHSSVILGALGLPQAPQAFVTGDKDALG